MPEPSDLPTGCKFHTRCPYATEQCVLGFRPGMDEWATEKDGFVVTLEGKNFVLGMDHADKSKKQKVLPGVYTWQENEDVLWTLKLEKQGYSLSRCDESGVVTYSGKFWNNQGTAVYCSPLSGMIPAVDLGGTHYCRCCNLDAVREAQKKEAAK